MDVLVLLAIFITRNGQTSDVVGHLPVLRAHKRGRSHAQFQETHATA